MTPAEAVPFDMFGVEFTRRGEHCTFETFCSVFQRGDLALAKMAGIVCNLDLKDERFGAPEPGASDSLSTASVSVIVTTRRCWPRGSRCLRRSV